MRFFGHTRDWRGKRVKPTLGDASPSNPFEIFLMLVGILYGTQIVIEPLIPGVRINPQTVAGQLTPPSAYVWAVALLVGGVLTLVGLGWRNRVTGIVLEQIGLVTVGSACVFYVVAIILLFGFDVGAFPGAITTAFGLACFARWFQLQKELSKLRALVLGDRIVEH